jgi:hypothetical protein
LLLSAIARSTSRKSVRPWALVPREHVRQLLEFTIHRSSSTCCLDSEELFHVLFRFRGALPREHVRQLLEFIDALLIWLIIARSTSKNLLYCAKNSRVDLAIISIQTRSGSCYYFNTNTKLGHTKASSINMHIYVYIYEYIHEYICILVTYIHIYYIHIYIHVD